MKTIIIVVTYVSLILGFASGRLKYVPEEKKLLEAVTTTPVPVQPQPRTVSRATPVPWWQDPNRQGILDKPAQRVK